MIGWLFKNLLTASFFVAALSGSVLAKQQPDGSTPATLAEARLEAARRAYKEAMDLYREGRTRDVDRVYLWSKRWLEAQRALSNKKADQRAALDAHFKRMRQLEELIKGRYRAGVAATIELPAVQFYRLEAEIWLSENDAK
jgi:hypothetical protein